MVKTPKKEKKKRTRKKHEVNSKLTQKIFHFPNKNVKFKTPSHFKNFSKQIQDIQPLWDEKNLQVERQRLRAEWAKQNEHLQRQQELEEEERQRKQQKKENAIASKELGMDLSEDSSSDESDDDESETENTENTETMPSCVGITKRELSQHLSEHTLDRIKEAQEKWEYTADMILTQMDNIKNLALKSFNSCMRLPNKK